MTGATGSTIEDVSQEGLEARIREVAKRLFSDQTFDDLETWHLAQVIEHCSKAISDIYRTVNLEQILRGDALKPTSLEDLQKVISPGSRKPLRRVTRVPGELKGIGDRCLYDIGMAGVRDYRGLSLATLGVRSYRMAAEILSFLADERDLRELFQRNRLRTLPIEEEIAFLKQCAARFGLHADLLSNLREESVGSSAFVSIPPPGLRDPEGSVGKERPPLDEDLHGAASLQSAAPKGLREPRERLLSRYERILLFAQTNIEEVRRDLKQRVIDQEAAVDALCDDFLINATGTQLRRIPQSYFLVGPTGVGKNYLMESLARVLEKMWGVEIPFLIIEGPQYTYPSDINELKGATRGFIRSDEPGLLTEFHERASRAPLSILIVDEVEKAHSQLQKFFLPIMDRGTTHDNRGQELSFEGCIVAFTSNLRHSPQDSLEPIGYRGRGSDRTRRGDERIERALRKDLSPEFVARLRVIRFSPLSRASMESILDLELKEIFERFRSLHGLQLRVTRAARRRLIEIGFSESQGARQLAAAVRRYCNIEVSRKIKQDEIPGSADRDETIQYLREVRSGDRAFESEAVERKVLRQARVRLPYRRVIIDESGGEFRYRGED
jgi:MoxR-like ATPase